MKMKKKINVLSLFAGAGGLDIGFENAGFNIICATDFDDDCANTYRKNKPDIPFIHNDIQNITSRDILKATNGLKPDVIIGGPPCQGFSTIGAKLSSDPRNFLFERFAYFTKEFKPKLFVIENVKAISTMYGGKYKDYIISTFKDIGYDVYFTVLNSADFGVPQVRQRAFFVGVLKGYSVFDLPRPTHGIGDVKHLGIGPFINDLANKDESFCENHIALEHSEVVIQRYRLIPEGGKLPPPDELPESLRRKNFGNTYKRLHRAKPSLTLVPGNNAFPVHPFLDRSLTPREAARIQTFPDNYKFTGNRRKQCIQVGNAVPPKLAEALACEVKNSYLKITKNACEISLQEGQQIIKSNFTNHYTFIDLFCGAGGFAVGFERAGFTYLCGNDINPNSRDTHESYFKNSKFVFGDITQKNVKSEILKNAKDDLFLLVGGPPCQGFSIYGNRRFVNTKDYDPMEDPRNHLVKHYVEMVKLTNPKWVIMENVSGFANLNDGYFRDYVIKSLKRIGYKNIEWKVLNCADYGVPQLRKRFVLIANRTNNIIPWPKKKFFQNPKDWQKPFRTVGEVISDLKTKKSFSEYTCHVPMNHKPLLVERLKYTPEGEKMDLDRMPDNLKKSYRSNNVKNYSGVYKRLHREKPSITLVPGHNAFPIHPTLNRSLTVREAARIQTFPDDMEFKGSRQEQCIQVGNAFPPLLAELIGNNIIKADKNNWTQNNLPSSASYALVDIEG
jgi:DNA (cytosine-5)-methyltransferase 1